MSRGSQVKERGTLEVSRLSMVEAFPLTEKETEQDWFRSRGMSAENEVALAEKRIIRIVWAGRTVAFLTAICVGAFLFFFANSEHTWQRWAYPALAVAPVVLAIISSHWTRLMHVTLLRRYQAQLLMRMSELEEMASRDQLTGIYNRRFFYERLQASLERARERKETMAILILDVDGLKVINDEYGHVIGDKVISNLGELMRKYTRGRDIPARLGGDEFGILMPDTDKRGAFALAQRLWEELERAPLVEEGNVQIMANVSIGVSGYPWGGEDVDEMMNWADADMYVNKASRKLPPQPVATKPRKVTEEDFF